MTPALYQRLKPLFEEALLRPPQVREAYLDEACAGELELREHLYALLEAEQQATGPLGVQAHLGILAHAALASFQPGQLILERFRIVRFISGGGMGEVYEADDLLLGKVALKTVRADIADSPDALRRLRQEVQLARRITGANICRIHEFFLMPAEAHGPAAFISMEYIDGETLASRLQSRGPLPCAEALRIALEICEGLCLIHAQGIIHRDLKPTNIMLCGTPGSERTVLMDFGLAHVPRHKQMSNEGQAASAEDEGSLPAEIGIVGTPAYMAPEQFSGEAVSPATDLYALGIVLYEISTGVQPYSASTPFAAAIRHARRPPPVSALRRDIPRHWDRVITGCLKYEPSERFQSADAVAHALNAGTFNPGNLWHDRRGLVNGAFAIILCCVAWLSLMTWQSISVYRPPSEAARFYHNGIEALDDGTYLKATHALNTAIERDPHFAMAHVRLAEAWNSLDFQVAAQQELLLAGSGEHRLSPEDTLQLQAVRSEVTGDFASAIAARLKLIAKLPHDQLSAAYVELGFARERDGQPEGALADYLKASLLDSENASAFLHAGILQSRLNKIAEGQASFDHAETIYRTQINQEGLANLHYERGYVANVLRNSAEAKSLLNQSLQEAQQIPSVQLQIRTLQQLSNATVRYNVVQAVAYANDAIRLARENRLDSWAAIGLVRLAAAQLWLGNLKLARETTNEGLGLARQTKQLRVEALANSQLASLENQAGHSADIIVPATSAREYYVKNGFFKAAATLSLLIGRAQRDEDQYDAAIKTAETSQLLAVKAGDRDLERNAEELLGTIMLVEEQLPEALKHYERARAMADAPSLQQYGDVMVSHLLWRLGRYKEFEQQLNFEPASIPIRQGILQERVFALVSECRFKEALLMIQQPSNGNLAMTDDFRNLLLPAKVIAEAHLRQEAETSADLELLKFDSTKADNAAAEELVSAKAAYALGHLAQAEADARKAAQWFHLNHRLDSELQSVATEALAARKSGHMSTVVDLNARCVDIMAEISQTWPSNDVKNYLSRPDIKALL